MVLILCQNFFLCLRHASFLQELEEAVIAHGLRVKDCETALTELNACQVELKEELSILQGFYLLKVLLFLSLSTC